MARRKALPVHMAKEEFAQQLAIVRPLQPRLCLEWGSGGSTRALLAECRCIERYVSIEHHRLWFERVRSMVQDRRLELYLRPPDPVYSCPTRWKSRIRAWDARAELDPVILADYVAFPATLGIRFDFVLVDGRARRFCLRAGWELLHPGGLLILRDAQRPEYRDVLLSLGTPELLQPWTWGQLAVLRKAVAGSASVANAWRV
ncbi:MAG TPA: hypothetical protein VGQ73_06015 [Gemmatimonadales bacterium]|nr:hypothetical protein [Gemmatimonadales bacterium]